MGHRVPKHVEQRILAAPGVVVDGKPLRAGSPDDGEDEKDFQKRVTELAESLGWDWHHQTVSKRSKSGWPDLALFRERAVYIELKSERGRLDGAQERWRDILLAAGQEWHCFRPSDWPEIGRVLGASMSTK